LQLTTTTISHTALEMLLKQGSQIISLTAWAIDVEASVADWQCCWQELALLSPTHPSVLYLAYLPLRGVTTLHLGAEGLGTLQLPSTSTAPSADLPALLIQAATNLSTCPAWKAQPQPANLVLVCPPFDASQPGGQHSFNDACRLRVLQALAPLGGPQVQAFELSMQGASSFQVGGRAENSACNGMGVA
jgi:hypothetical protein